MARQKKALREFHTFGGDGTFPSFYGYDARDRLVCLVTDMLLYHTVFDGWREPEARE